MDGTSVSMGVPVTGRAGSRDSTKQLRDRFGVAALRATSTAGERAFALFLATVVWIVALGIGPIVVALVIELINMARNDDTASPGATAPLRVVLVIAVAVAALALNYLWIRTFTWAMKSAGELRRHHVAWFAFGSLGVLLRGMTLGEEDAPGWLDTMSAAAAVLLVVAWLAPLLRAAAGALRLVPASWREASPGPKRGKRR